MSPLIKAIHYKPIGILHTPFGKTGETPIQGVFSQHARGRVEVFPRYVEGLQDIEGFSHLILLYHFHQATACRLRLMPFLEDQERGIFSIRHFNRPNPIGFSLVKLLGVTRNILEVEDVDMFDGTPLLDIKPYVRQFDGREGASSGWVDGEGIDFDRGRAGNHD